jgi:hypothetical protein
LRVRGRHHSSVVRAQFGRGDITRYPPVFSQLQELLTELAVPGHSSTQDQGPRLDVVNGLVKVVEQGPDHACLETGDEIQEIRMCPGDPEFADLPEARGLEPAEAKIQASIGHLGPRKRETLRIPLGGQPIDNRAAGVAQAEEFCDLVQGLSCGIVPGLGEQSEVQRPLELEKRCVPPTDQERQDRIGDIPVLDERRIYVGLQVVGRDQRPAVGVGQSLGKGEADQQGADQARALGHGKGLDLIDPQSGALQTFAHHICYGTDVPAGRQFGYDPAVGGMDLIL